jgi:heparan-alpha-glucosaminide N-acetyltransferase
MNEFYVLFFLSHRITILMMIFVNYGAGEYVYLDHAAWDGFNFADIIFPWFIFIMGTTMAIRS